MKKCMCDVWLSDKNDIVGRPPDISIADMLSTYIGRQILVRDYCMPFHWYIMVEKV